MKGGEVVEVKMLGPMREITIKFPRKPMSLFEAAAFGFLVGLFSAAFMLACGA
jgi:hypothetical protein